MSRWPRGKTALIPWWKRPGEKRWQDLYEEAPEPEGYDIVARPARARPGFVFGLFLDGELIEEHRDERDARHAMRMKARGRG